MHHFAMTQDPTYWTEQLKSTGRLEIGMTSKRISWWYYILAFLGIVFVFARGVLERVIPLSVAVGILAAMCAFVLILSFWSQIRFPGGTIVVEHDSITLLDGTRFYWTEVERAGLFSNRGVNPAVFLALTPLSWEQYLRGLPFWIRWNNLFNQRVLKERMVFLPFQLELDPTELAPWLNQFPQATSMEAAEPEPVF